MSKKTGVQDTGAEAVARGGAGADPAAMALALNGASREALGGFSREAERIDRQARRSCCLGSRFAIP